MKINELLEKQLESELNAWIEKIHDELSKKLQSADKLNYSKENSNICFKVAEDGYKIFIGTNPDNGTLIGLARRSVGDKLWEHLRQEGYIVTSEKRTSGIIYFELF